MYELANSSAGLPMKRYAAAILARDPARIAVGIAAAVFTSTAK